MKEVPFSSRSVYHGVVGDLSLVFHIFIKNFDKMSSKFGNKDISVN